MSTSIPLKQKVLYLLEKQGDWAVGQADVSKPGPGEIVVKVEATGLNPADWKTQVDGGYTTQYPAILGMDAAGVVAAIGHGVQNVSCGDRVFHEGLFTNHLSTFKEYSVVPADIAGKIPDNITFDQAASLPTALSTAALALYGPKWANGGAALCAPWDEGKRNFYSRQPIVIFGGSSAVGSYAIQLAKLSGFSPIITTSSPHNFDLLRSYGATHTLDRKLTNSELTQEIKEITSDPIRIVFDVVSSVDTQNLGYDLLSYNGHLILSLPSLIDESKQVPEKEITFVIGNVHLEPHRKFGADFYSHLTDLLAVGDIKPIKTLCVPGGLSAIPEQLEKLKKGEISGQKIVVRPQETP